MYFLNVIKNSKKSYQIINFLLVLIFILCRFLFFDLISENFLKILESLIFIDMIYSVIYFYLEKKYIGVKFFYLCSFILYSLTRAMLDLLDIFPLSEIRKFNPNVDILKEVVLILGVALFSLIIGMSCKIKKKERI